MFIAREKKKSNIAEYILYMWQIEDMLRAFRLDIDLVRRNVVDAFQVDDVQKKEALDWYDNIIEMMKQEKVEAKGHIQVLKNNVDELTELHFYLLQEIHDRRYQQIVTMAAANLVDFRAKSGVGNEVSDVELALNALYGHLMLRLQKKEINEQTVAAMDSFSRMIAYLAAKYKEMEEKEDTELRDL